MKAKFVLEEVKFQRGGDPRESIGIGSIEKIIEDAIAAGYNIDPANPDLSILLKWASSRGTMKDVKILLSRGANPNGDFDFVSPLMSAAERGRWDIFYHLIDRGAKIMNTDQRLINYIIEARNSKDYEIKEAIDTVMKKGYELEPFDFYRASNHVDLPKVRHRWGILNHLIDKWYPEDINSEFTMEVLDLEIRLIERFLKRGFDPNYNNSSPLQLAFKKKNIYVFELLLKEGAIPRDRLIRTISQNPKHHKYADFLRKYGFL